MHEALSSGIDPDRQAWWNELHRSPKQFYEDFCEEVGLTWQVLANMPDIQFERLQVRWSRFRTVPDFPRDERRAVSERIEYFPILHHDGTAWQAPRQQMSDGHFRTPDDPTPAVA